MKLRALRPGESEALLELLDLWPMPDGWRGRDFFRRYLEQDPTFRPENIVLAEEGGRPVACVQIFPRRVRLRGRAVPMGGIGSVFTHPQWRGRGLARRLLTHATERMRERGLELSLLFAGVIPLYQRLGWRSWNHRALLLSRRPGARRALSKLAAERFDASRDLAAVRGIHDAYSAELDGTVVRDDALWQASLRVAGNPDEEFLVARRVGEVVAYVRAIVLNGFLVVSELGRRPDAARELAELLAHILTPRADDPLAGSAHTPAQLRDRALLPAPEDPALLRAVEAHALALRTVQDPTAMWRCVDPAGLALRVGVESSRDEDAEALLRRVLPPGRARFWPADRF